jgi:hypothetical protein
VSGNAYLTCTFQGSNAAPAISAVTSDTRVNDLIGKLTGGKTLGDLAKNFTGEASASSVGGYVAGALGFPAELGKGLGKQLEKIEAIVGNDRGPMTGASYASKGSSLPGSKSGGSGELDFSKMMEGLLKQMNPEETTAGNRKENASEAVFRRLDLLPPDKIEANKNISLFIRIGHRYRKKTPSILSREMDQPQGQR